MQWDWKIPRDELGRGLEFLAYYAPVTIETEVSINMSASNSFLKNYLWYISLII